MSKPFNPKIARRESPSRFSMGLPVLIWLILSACNSQNQGIVSLNELPQNRADYQSVMVAELSGHQTLPDGSKMVSRWSAYGRAQAKDYLKARLEELGLTAREHNYKAPNLSPAIDLILNPFKGSNVYAVLPATEESNEYVVLGAHYDTGKRGAPGAIDNATGIALIYSVLKELTQTDQRARNVMVVFFDQEEEELIGSQAFAGWLADTDWEVHSVHCFDMVGWDSNGDWAMETFSPNEQLSELYRQVAQKRGIPLFQKAINPVGFEVGATDFDAFVLPGFSVIGAGECYYHGDSSPYKDTPEDTYETVNFDYLLSCTQLVEEVIKSIVI